MVGKKEGAIALYDSGRGVESVLRVCQKVLPNEQWLVLKDVNNQPYGSKSDQVIIEAGFACFRELMKRNIKAIVVACHTSSAIALPSLRKHFAVPMVGMLYPTARMLAEKHRYDDIIWLATPASVKADRLEPLARHLGFQGQWHAVECPHWVDCIEGGRASAIDRLLMAWVKQHQALLQMPNVKILYGCTHYPLVHRNLKRYLPGFDCIDPACAVVDALERMLDQTGILRQEANPGVNFLKSVVFSGRMRLLAAEGIR